MLRRALACLKMNSKINCLSRCSRSNWTKPMNRTVMSWGIRTDSKPLSSTSSGPTPVAPQLARLNAAAMQSLFHWRNCLRYREKIPLTKVMGWWCETVRCWGRSLARMTRAARTVNSGRIGRWTGTTLSGDSSLVQRLRQRWILGSNTSATKMLRNL